MEHTHIEGFGELADDNFNAMEAYEAECARIAARGRRVEATRLEIDAFERWQRICSARDFEAAYRFRRGGVR